MKYLFSLKIQITRVINICCFTIKYTKIVSMIKQNQAFDYMFFENMQPIVADAPLIYLFMCLTNLLTGTQYIHSATLFNYWASGSILSYEASVTRLSLREEWALQLTLPVISAETVPSWLLVSSQKKKKTSVSWTCVIKGAHWILDFFRYSFPPND